MEDNPLVETIEAELVEVKEELDDEKQKTQELEKEIKRLRIYIGDTSKYDSLAAEDSWDDSEEEEPMFSAKELKNSAQAEKKQVAILKSQVMELTKENDRLKEQIQSESARIHTSFQDMDTSQSLTDLRELSQFEGIQLAHEQEVRALRERIGKLEHELQKWSDRLNEAEEDKLTLLEEKVELQKYCDDILQQKTNFEKEVMVLKQSIEELENSTPDGSIQTHKLYAEIDRLQDDNSKMIEDLEGLVRMNDQLHEENASLKEQVGNMDEQERYREKVRAETEHLQQEKQDLAKLMEEIRHSMHQSPEEKKTVESIISVNITESDLVGITNSPKLAVSDLVETELPHKRDANMISKHKDKPIEVYHQPSLLAALALEEINLVDEDVNVHKPQQELQLELLQSNSEGEIKSMVEEKEKELDELEKEKSKMENEVSELQFKLKNLNSSYEEMKKQRENELLSVQKQIDISEKEANNIKMYFDATKLQLEVVAAEVEEHEIELKQLEGKCLKTQEELEFVEKALVIQKEELHGTEMKLASQKRKELEKEHEIEHNKTSAKKEVSTLVSQLEKLNEEMGLKRKEYVELESQKHNIETEKLQALQFKEATQKELQMLEKEKLGLLNEHKTLESKIDLEKVEWERLEHDVEKLRKERALQDLTQSEESPIVVEQTKSIIVGAVPRVEIIPVETAVLSTIDKHLYDQVINEKSCLSSEVAQLRTNLEKNDKLYSKTISDLEGEIKDLKQKNVILKRECDTFEADIASGMNYRAECERMLTENEHLLKELHDARMDNGSLEIITLKNQNEELHTERKQLECNNDELQTLIQALQISVNNNKTDDKNREDENHNEIFNLKEDMSKLKAVNIDLLNENEQLKQDKDVLNSNITTLQKASEEIIQDQQLEKESNDQIIKKLHDDNERLFLQIESLHREKGELESLVGSLQNTLDDVIKERKKDEPSLSDEEEAEEFRQIQRDLDHALKKLDIVESEKEKLDSDLKALQSTEKEGSVELSERLQELEQKVMSVEKEKQTLKDLNDDLISRIDNIKKSDEQPQQEIIAASAVPTLETSPREKINKDQEKILQDKNEKLSKAIESLTNTNQKLAMEIGDLNKQVEVLKLEQDAQLENEATQFQDEIDRLIQNNKDLRSEISRLHVHIEDLKDDNENKLQDLMEEQDMLLEKIKSLESRELAHRKQQQVIPDGGVSEKDEIIQDLETQCQQLKKKVDEKDKLCKELNEKVQNKKNESVTIKSGSYLTVLKEENESLRLQVQQLQDELGKLSNGISESDAEEEVNKTKILKLQKDIIVLRKQLAVGIENEKKNREVVNTYRTHLLAAVQGCMDPDVKKSLKHIITLRNNNQL